MAKNKRLPAFLQLGPTREQIEKSPILKRLRDQLRSNVSPGALGIYEGPIPESLKPVQLPEDHPLAKFLTEAQKAQEQENEPEVDEAQERGDEPKIEPKIEPEIERARVDQPLRRRPKIEFKHLPQVLEALRLEQAKDSKLKDPKAAITFVIKKLKDLKIIVKESQVRTITRRIQEAGLLPKPRTKFMKLEQNSLG